MEYYLSRKASTSIYDDINLNAIHATLGTTLRSGNTPEITEILRMLLDHDVDPSTPDMTGQRLTPLHRAAYNRDLDSVELLLEQKTTELDAVDTQGQTPLRYACTDRPPDSNVLGIVIAIASKGGTFGDHEWPNMSPRVADIIRENL